MIFSQTAMAQLFTSSSSKFYPSDSLSVRPLQTTFPKIAPAHTHSSFPLPDSVLSQYEWLETYLIFRTFVACLLALDCEFQEGEIVVSCVLMPNVLVFYGPFRKAALQGSSEPSRMKRLATQGVNCCKGSEPQWESRASLQEDSPTKGFRNLKMMKSYPFGGREGRTWRGLSEPRQSEDGIQVEQFGTHTGADWAERWRCGKRVMVGIRDWL